MDLFFWMLLNLAVPVAGPVFTLALVMPVHGRRAAKTLIAASVKDGQLFWCAIGLCTAAIYEAVTALEQGSMEMSLLAMGIVGFSGLAFVCSIIVTTSLLNVRHDGSGAAIGDAHANFVIGTFSRATIGVSLSITCLVIVLFAALHIHLN